MSFAIACPVIPSPAALLAMGAGPLHSLGMTPVAAVYLDQPLWGTHCTDAGSAFYIIPHGGPSTWVVIPVHFQARNSPDAELTNHATVFSMAADFQDLATHLGPTGIDAWFGMFTSDNDTGQWFRCMHPSRQAMDRTGWQRVGWATVSGDVDDIIDERVPMYGRPAWHPLTKA
jgi:hypothetical protein